MSAAELIEFGGWLLLAWVVGFGLGTFIRNLRRFAEHV